MVPAPGEYPWSSYRANALGDTDIAVTPHALDRELAGSAETRLAGYRRLFEDVLSAELLRRLRDCTNGGFVLSSPRFRAAGGRHGRSMDMEGLAWTTPQGDGCRRARDARFVENVVCP
jgi:hypothetical protein